MKARSAEYLEAARRRLSSAEQLVGADPSTALSVAYYAALYAARAARSEHDVQARSHRGAWHESVNGSWFDGSIDAGFAAVEAVLQGA